MLEEKEIEIAIVLYPETYDYVKGDIVYRITANNQLFVERVFPAITSDKMLVERFIFSYEHIKNIKVNIQNIGNKKIKIARFFINKDRLVNGMGNTFTYSSTDYRIQITSN